MKVTIKWIEKPGWRKLDLEDLPMTEADVREIVELDVILVCNGYDELGCKVLKNRFGPAGVIEGVSANGFFRTLFSEMAEAGKAKGK